MWQNVYAHGALPTCRFGQWCNYIAFVLRWRLRLQAFSRCSFHTRSASALVLVIMFRGQPQPWEEQGLCEGTESRCCRCNRLQSFPKSLRSYHGWGCPWNTATSSKTTTERPSKRHLEKRAYSLSLPAKQRESPRQSDRFARGKKYCCGATSCILMRVHESL